MSKSNQSMQPLYCLKGVKKTFHIGSVESPALRDINLEIPKGIFVSMQGPSGSGKSTLLNVLGILEQPTSGDVIFEGETLTGKSENQLTLLRRRAVGFIFQNYNLVPILSAAENVEYPLYLTQKFSGEEIRGRAMAALIEVGLEKFAKHKPAELSGGQRQRVAIARALVKNPDVILADEPTANLDSKTARQIMELIQSLQHKIGTTVVIATHDDAVAAMADRHVHIRDGEVLRFD